MISEHTLNIKKKNSYQPQTLGSGSVRVQMGFFCCCIAPHTFFGMLPQMLVCRLVTL